MREGRSTRLSKKRIENLNTIGFVWVARKLSQTLKICSAYICRCCSLQYLVELKFSSKITLLIARGCSGLLKRLREHEVNYQQEQQARQNNDPENGEKLNRTAVSTDKHIVEATAKVCAAAAEIIHGAPTMGQWSLTSTTPPLHAINVCDLIGRSHDTPSYQFLRDLAQQSQNLPYPNNNMTPPFFSSSFDIGLSPQEQNLGRIVQQHTLLAHAALLSRITHQAPTSVFAKPFQGMAGTNYCLDNNSSTSVYQQTLAGLLASTLPSNVTYSAPAIVSTGLDGIVPSDHEATHSNFRGNLFRMSAGLGMSTNFSMPTHSNINAYTSSKEGHDRNHHEKQM